MTLAFVVPELNAPSGDQLALGNQSHDSGRFLEDWHSTWRAKGNSEQKNPAAGAQKGVRQEALPPPRAMHRASPGGQRASRSHPAPVWGWNPHAVKTTDYQFPSNALDQRVLAR